MTEPEVVKMLGKPVSRAHAKDGSVTLYYVLREAPWNSTRSSAGYSVRLVENKVDWYGRDEARPH